MPKVSVVMPVYGVEKFVAAAIDSVLSQTFTDFEFIIVDDCSPDGSLAICQSYKDPRMRIVSHENNRGLAGARNTGIRHAHGEYIALLDSDDMWLPEKLEKHVKHLDTNPDVGVSFSRSAFVDEAGMPMNAYQMPKLKDIDVDHLLCRNPVGNGSAPVLRATVLADIRTEENLYGDMEAYYFDDTFRQSEDIECWIRIAATTQWRFEGLSEALTLYRLNAGGLSANIPKQLASWDAVMDKTRSYAPDLISRSGKLARAFQLRYLARQAIRLKDGTLATQYVLDALRENPRIFFKEPGRTSITLVAALIQRVLPGAVYKIFEPAAIQVVGVSQKLRIALR